MTDTTEHLTELLKPTDAPTVTTDAWTITNLTEASWAARKAATARNRQARVKAWAAEEKGRIDQVAAAEIDRDEREAAFFEGHLAAYLRAEIAAGRPTKSLALPAGTIKLMAQPPRLDVDPAAFLAWAQTHRPDLVRIKAEPDKVRLRKLAQLAEDGIVTVDGEIVPGAAWEPQEDTATFAPADK